MRTAFVSQLIKEAEQHPDIFLIIGDLGFNVVEEFAKKFPDRFLNAGIAEQNMIGVAAGLAKEGYNVYVYSIANFPTLRCIEQIRYDVCYHNLSVKIVAVGAGYAYGSLGSSHHATEEMGMMRTIPDLVVASPGDPIEAKSITTLSANYQGPMYLRLGKAGEKQVHATSFDNMMIGDIVALKQGSTGRSALLATGSILHYANEFISEKGIDTSLYSVPFIKPLNKQQIKELAQKHNNIIVLEEHQKSAGLGSAIIEQVSDMYASGEISVFPKIKRVAIDDCFYHLSGSQAFLRKNAGLLLHENMFE
jgi:transketolase